MDGGIRGEKEKQQINEEDRGVCLAATVTQLDRGGGR